MDLVDADGSGEIDFDEFVEMFERVQSGEVKCEAFKKVLTSWNDGSVVGERLGVGQRSGAQPSETRSAVIPTHHESYQHKIKRPHERM